MANIDFTYLETLSEGDIDFINEFISTFEKNCDELIAAMRKDLKEEQYRSLGKCAHTLKPSIKMLNLDSLNDLLSIQNAPEGTTDEKITTIEKDCHFALEELKNWRLKFK